jgi:DNA-binding transcriptional MerR regulator
LDIFGGEETHPERKADASPAAQRVSGRLTPPAVVHMEESEEPVAETASLPGDKQSEAGDQAPAARKSSRGRKSLREMSLQAARVEIPEDEVLFSKQYYGIGEVAAMFQVNASLLRYWESEFDVLKLRKNRKGDRFFRPDDIKNLKLIHHLLRERKYTIEGAKDLLKKSNRSRESFEAVESLKRIRSFLLGLKAGL